MSEGLTGSSKPNEMTNARSVGHVVVAALVLTTAIGVLEGVFGWAAGWNTAARFSDCYFISGSILCLLGLLTAVAKPRFKANPESEAAQPSGKKEKQAGISPWWKELIQGYNALILLVISGALLIGLSLLVI